MSSHMKREHLLPDVRTRQRSLCRGVLLNTPRTLFHRTAWRGVSSPGFGAPACLAFQRTAAWASSRTPLRNRQMLVGKSWGVHPAGTCSKGLWERWRPADQRRGGADSRELQLSHAGIGWRESESGAQDGSHQQPAEQNFCFGFDHFIV